MITIGIPTLNRYDLLAECVASAHRGTVKPDMYVIIDNGGKLNEEVFAEELRDRVRIMQPGRNLGVAKSWNLLITAVDEYLIICNDDIVFYPDCVEKFVDHATKHPNHGMIYGQADTMDNAFSCFMFRKWLHEEIGPFDERFYPAYFEDNDMWRRMWLAGRLTVNLPNARYHHSGSATLKAYSPADTEEHHRRFRANQRYFLDKWGGMPHEERFTSPFNQ